MRSRATTPRLARKEQPEFGFDSIERFDANRLLPPGDGSAIVERTSKEQEQLRSIEANYCFALAWVIPMDEIAIIAM